MKSTEVKEKKIEKNEEIEEIDVKEQKIVVPGEIIGEGMDFIAGQNTFRRDDKVYSKRLGLLSNRARVLKVVPLSGGYMPNPRDEVVGVVLEVSNSGWQIDIGCPYQAYLPISEYSMQFIDTKQTDPVDLLDAGDLIYCRVIKYTKTKNLLVSMKGPKYKKLQGGLLNKITPQKIPRLIGKQGSMISLIKNETNSFMMVGPNGWVFIQNDDPSQELKVKKVLNLIENESHKMGLTEKVQNLLKGDK